MCFSQDLGEKYARPLVLIDKFNSIFPNIKHVDEKCIYELLEKVKASEDDGKSKKIRLTKYDFHTIKKLADNHEWVSIYEYNNSRKCCIMIKLLIESWIQFSQVQFGRINYNPEKSNLRNCIMYVMDAFIEENIESRFKMYGDTETFDSEFNFDKIKFECLLFNLLFNAFKFSQEGTNIE